MQNGREEFETHKGSEHEQRNEHSTDGTRRAATRNTAHVDIDAGTEANAADATDSSELDQVTAERDQLAQQLVQSQDRLARLQAEFDNTRKREIKERQDARDYAIQSAVEPFLGVMDNFALALRPTAT